MTDLTTEMKLKPSFEGLDTDLVSVLLSSRRTGLSLHRTRMSADRTLMSVVRTALALIGFGFTIFQFFNFLRKSDTAVQALPEHAPRNFGLALIAIGVGALILGIWGHLVFMRNLRAQRKELAKERLIVTEHEFPISTTLVMAVCLLLLGCVAAIAILLRTGPFK